MPARAPWTVTCAATPCGDAQLRRGRAGLEAHPGHAGPGGKVHRRGARPGAHPQVAHLEVGQRQAGLTRARLEGELERHGGVEDDVPVQRARRSPGSTGRRRATCPCSSRAGPGRACGRPVSCRRPARRRSFPRAGHVAAAGPDQEPAGAVTDAHGGLLGALERDAACSRTGPACAEVAPTTKSTPTAMSTSGQNTWKMPSRMTPPEHDQDDADDPVPADHATFPPCPCAR